MPTYNISFEVTRPDTLDLPVGLLDNGRYQIKIEKDGSIEIIGNRDGLLYLAEVLVRCAIGSYEPGFHLHLPLDSDTQGPNVDASPELTIYAASPRGRHLAVDK